MNADLLNHAAEQAAERYGRLLEGFQAGFLLASMSVVEQGLDRTRTELLARAYEQAGAWLEEERPALDLELSEMANQAAETLDTTPSAPALDHIAAIGEALDTALRVQIERDIATMAAGLRDIALRAALAARARGVARGGVVSPIRGDIASRLRFDFADRSNRRWSSERHVRTLWRQALVYAWNETALILLTEQGFETAAILHPDPNHAARGVVIQLGEEGEGMGWAEARDEFFHPNTHSYVGKP